MNKLYGISHNDRSCPGRPRCLHRCRAERSFRAAATQARRFGLVLERGAAPARSAARCPPPQPHDPQRDADRSGRAAAGAAAPALGEVAGALDQVNSFRDSPTGTLRLNVPPSSRGRSCRRSRRRFLKAYPGITLEVTADDSFIDVLAAGFDAGVRYDERLEQDMIAVPIGPRQPAFRHRRGAGLSRGARRAAHPTELLEHACIRHRFASGVDACLGVRAAATRRSAFRPPGCRHRKLGRSGDRGRGRRPRHHRDFEEFVAPHLNPAPLCRSSKIG